MSGDPSDSQGRIAAVLVSTTALRCVARKPASLAPELRRLRSRLDKRPSETIIAAGQVAGEAGQGRGHPTRVMSRSAE